MVTSMVMANLNSPYHFQLGTPLLNGTSLGVSLTTTANMSSIIVTTFILKTNLQP